MFACPNWGDSTVAAYLCNKPKKEVISSVAIRDAAKEPCGEVAAAATSWRWPRWPPPSAWPRGSASAGTTTPAAAASQTLATRWRRAPSASGTQSAHGAQTPSGTQWYTVTWHSVTWPIAVQTTVQTTPLKPKRSKQDVIVSHSKFAWNKVGEDKKAFATIPTIFFL